MVQFRFEEGSLSLNDMFNGCHSVISLDLSDLNALYIVNTENMFYGCENLKSLVLPEFALAKYANNMFYNCRNLQSLDLSKFDSPPLENVNGMLYGCSSLTSLDLSFFNRGIFTHTKEMFYNCSNLQSLDLSNFDTTYIENYNNMFLGCHNLKYIKLYNFQGDINIFENSILNSEKLNICINDEKNNAASFLPNATRNCPMTILNQLRINYCLDIQNINYGLYIGDKIIKLDNIEECIWIYNIKMIKGNLIFKNILYKENIIIRMDSESKNLNVTNIIETDSYEGCTLNHTYSSEGILYCDLDDF